MKNGNYYDEKKIVREIRTTDYPLPIEDFEKVVHDGVIPRSVRSDLDFITAQRKRIAYLDKRVEMLEKQFSFELNFYQGVAEEEIDRLTKEIEDLHKNIIEHFENKTKAEKLVKTSIGRCFIKKEEER